MHYSSNHESKLSTAEFNSLHDFYNATNGPFWIWHNVSVQSTHWNFSIPGVNPCLDDWQGLVCNCGLKSCTVNVLFLDHHNLTGHLPDSMENFSKMSQLILRGNNITGTITRSIGNMTELEILDLSYNRLYGEIPSSIGRLSKLRSLNLGVNRLTKIPEKLYELKDLQGLSLFNNRIEGIISSRIGNLSSLETLQLQVNDFSPQTIPKEMGSLRSLKTLDLSHNSFIGPIPISFYGLKNLTSWTMISTNLSCLLDEAIGNLTNLNSLDLSRSNFQGTIPSSIGNLTNLVILALNDNDFIRTVPPSISNFRRLRALFLQANLLSGKVDSLARLNATIFYLHQNSFTGTFIIPQNGLGHVGYFDVSMNQLGGPVPWNREWRMLGVYEVYDNFFSGNLPSETKLYYLRYFVAGVNYLTSTIPNGFLNQSSLIYSLDLNKNLLTGTLPTTLGNFSKTGQISLSSNFLTGTLPDLQNNKLMVVLDVSFNRLHGSIPRTLSLLHFLEELFIQYNAFTGEVSSFLNGTSQRKLVNVDVSGNEFTGTVPESVFIRCRGLESFAASSNCLIGSISEEICHSHTLLSLSLDGLTTSDNCKTKLFPGLPYLDGFTVSHFIQGSIPACLFEMPKLQLLHLSGNGLTGSIAQDLNMTESLRDLSLSHNSLTGTIPWSIQLKTWENLDLSYNKLSGTLSSDFASPFENGAISLEVNRLSGNVPWNLVDFNNTDMLSGNIFSCNLLQSNLPQSDPDAINYSCGSDSVNNVLYTWLGAIICLPLLLMVLFKANVRARSSLEASKKESSMREELAGAVSKLNAWRAALRQDDNRVNLTRLSIYFSEVRQGTLRLTAYCMLILIPLYSVLKVYSSSYAIEYAWWISAMLMNGEAAAIVLFVSLMLFAMLYVRTLKGIVMKLNVRMPKEKRKKEKGTSKHEGGESGFEIVAIYSLIVLANVLIMALADFSYVYIVISFNSLVVTFAALGLALFRLLTNHVLLWFAIPWTSSMIVKMKRWCGNRMDRSSREIKSPLQYSAKDISFLENLALFNNIVIPCLAIVFILPDCFYNALFASGDVQSSYYYNSCYQYTPVIGITHICETYEALVLYSPPYLYSYQCSSKIVINYVPVYVLMFILAGMIIPSLKVGLKVLYDGLRESESEISKKLRGLVELILPQYLKEWRSDLNEKLTEIGEEPSQFERSVAARTMFVGEGEGRKKLLFSKLTMTVQINSYLTILMCFGALFPPLALIAAVSIYSITYFEELWIGWVLTETRGLGLGYGWYEEQIERECEGVEESSNLTIWSTLVVSCCLYGYMIFDTMGDRVGWEGALPMTLVMMLLPFLFFLVFRVKSRFLPDTGPPSTFLSIVTSLFSRKPHIEAIESENPMMRQSVRQSSVQMISTDHSISKEGI